MTVIELKIWLYQWFYEHGGYVKMTGDDVVLDDSWNFNDLATDLLKELRHER